MIGCRRARPGERPVGAPRPRTDAEQAASRSGRRRASAVRTAVAQGAALRARRTTCGAPCVDPSAGGYPRRGGTAISGPAGRLRSSVPSPGTAWRPQTRSVAPT